MRRRTVVIILITLIVVVFGLYFIMVGKLPVELMRPEIRKVYHYWGEITPGTTEVRTIITVYNPNPVPIPLKAIEFELFMNDIRMAYGTLKESVSLSPRAETNIRVVSLLDNRKIPEWWVKHLKRHESTEVRLTGRVLVDLKVTTISIPFEQIFTVKTDIIERMCVKEPREIEIPTPIRPIKLILKSVTSLWGKITSERTEIIHKVVIYNPNPIPIPIPQMEYRIVANGVLIGKGTLYSPGMLKPVSEETI